MRNHRNFEDRASAKCLDQDFLSSTTNVIDRMVLFVNTYCKPDFTNAF